VWEWIRKCFDNSEFMPHGRCWAWEPWVVWSNVLSDATITISYLTIGCTLLWFVRRRKDLAFDWMFLLFASFIVACGLTHAMEVLNTWNGYFRLAGVIKILTAAVSLSTAVLLIRIIPKALELPTPDGMERINATLRESEEGLRRLMDGVKDYAIVMLDSEGRISRWNKGAERINGYAEAEVLGRHFSCFYTDTDQAAGMPDDALRIAQEQGRYEAECWRVRKDRSLYFADVVITPVMTPEGALQGFAKITRDISERQAMQQQLRAHQEELERTVARRTRELGESQRTLKLIYDAHQDPMFLLEVHPDGQYRIVSCNQACARSAGLRLEEIEGSFFKAYLREPKEPVMEACRTAAQERHPLRLERRVKVAEVERVYDSEVIPILNDQGECTHLLFASRDITDRSRMEESLRQSQKLESLGVLAGGIAHDFNNLLTSILGNANLATLVLPVESPGREYLQQIEAASLKAADLTRQLLAYAGKGKFVLTEVDLNRAVHEMTQLLAVSISKKAALRFDLSVDCPQVMGDPAQIQQLIMNLVTNASEAIGEETSGLITIRTGVQLLDAGYIKNLDPMFPLVPGRYATLEVSDSGCGMSLETQSRIFDPFFTTKFTGRGLGLSAMMGILRSHQGSLKIYSEVGRGSTFKLFLPATKDTAVKMDALPLEGNWRGHGKLLLVDDEAGARRVGREAAEMLGFEVLEATDGREAVEVFRSQHASLTLVIMDLTMPHMDGREAFLAIRAIDDSVPVILSSGYSESDAAQAFVGKGLAGFLQKPYRIDQFTALVRQVLNEH
jgi:two-component system cell cycle sensor histidine kinase/response regulator CckA